MKESLSRKAAPLALLFATALALPAIPFGAFAASHPTLFFTAADVSSLQMKQLNPLRLQLHSLLLFTAEWALRIEIPREPMVQGPKVDMEGKYSTKGLVSSKDFMDAGVAIQSVMPVLGLSYHLTGDRKYADRGIQWLKEYSQWKQFDVGKPDIQGAASLVGIVVGYDMFYSELNTAERSKVLDSIQRETARFVRKASSLSKLSLESGNRVVIASNHNIVPVCAAGMGALLLKLEGLDDGEMLQTVVNSFRQSIFPSAFSSEGEYTEGTENWLVYVMQSMTIFFEAVRRNGGPNLWEEGNVRKVPEFMIRADSLNAEDAPYNYRWRYTLLAMASVYRDAELQGLALKEGFSVGGDAKELGFRRRKAPEDNALVKRWFSAGWEYLFYDPTLESGALNPRPLSVIFPSLGRAILRSSWKSDASVVTFRAGPRVGKDRGDNIAFQLKAFGTELFPSLEAPFWPLNERGAQWHDERDWILGTQGSNTVIVDGVRQYSMLDPRYKGKNSRKRPPSAWLSTPDEGITSQAKITGFLTSPLVDYVCGEAAKAYKKDDGNPLLNRFSRHLFFIKDEYLVIFDDVECSGEAARNIEWIFHAGRKNEVNLHGNGFTISPGESGSHVSLEFRVLSPKVTMKIEKAPAKNKSYRSPYVSIRQLKRENQVRTIFVLDLKRGSESIDKVFLRQNDKFVTVLKIGNDLIVWNRTFKPFHDNNMTLRGRLAWIRPGVSALVIDGTTLTWRGKPLINQKTATSTYWLAD